MPKRGTSSKQVPRPFPADSDIDVDSFIEGQTLPPDSRETYARWFFDFLRADLCDPHPRPTARHARRPLGFRSSRNRSEQVLG